MYAGSILKGAPEKVPHRVYHQGSQHFAALGGLIPRSRGMGHIFDDLEVVFLGQSTEVVPNAGATGVVCHQDRPG
jgi:hypothetical protein